MADEIFMMLDLETDGLDAKGGHILEIGALHIHMQTLEILARFQVTAGMSEEEQAKRLKMDAYVTKMHTENGLLADMKNGRAASQHALDHILSFWFMARGAEPGKKIILCGNSIHFDRGFMENRLPYSFEFLHHRVVDTSSFATCFKQWTGVDKRHTPAHRAIDDCLASLEILKWQKRMTEMAFPGMPEFAQPR